VIDSPEMDSSSPDVIAHEAYDEPVVPRPCASHISASVYPHRDMPIRLRSRIRCRVPGARAARSRPVSDAPARGARPGSPASNPYKTRPFRATPAFLLTWTVRACTLTAMLTTTATATAETTGGRPLSTPLRSHLRALAMYRGMCRDHGWACSVLEALLRTATVTIRSARTCRCCRGLGLGCVWPPVGCSVCGGVGYEVRT
jgi:hypothetical protein